MKANMMTEDKFEAGVCGILPKNICVNLKGCRDPESCAKR